MQSRRQATHIKLENMNGRDENCAFVKDKGEIARGDVEAPETTTGVREEDVSQISRFRFQTSTGTEK